MAWTRRSTQSPPRWRVTRASPTNASSGECAKASMTGRWSSFRRRPAPPHRWGGPRNGATGGAFWCGGSIGRVGMWRPTTSPTRTTSRPGAILPIWNGWRVGSRSAGWATRTGLSPISHVFSPMSRRRSAMAAATTGWAAHTRRRATARRRLKPTGRPPHGRPVSTASLRRRRSARRSIPICTKAR